MMNTVKQNKVSLLEWISYESNEWRNFTKKKK